ncbi:MAG: hypothetical protein ABIB93_03830 [Chloroflexota bacterium]
MECQYCTRCQLASDGDFLREIARSEKRSLQDVLGQAQQAKGTSVQSGASKFRDQRMEEAEELLEQYEAELKQSDEEASYEAVDNIFNGKSVDQLAEKMLRDESRQKLIDDIQELKWQPQEITEEDMKRSLEEYEKQGYIEIKHGKIRITSKGAKKLATGALERILCSLEARKEVGTRPTGKTGFGSDLSLYARPYEVGDDYALINIEKTLLNALRRRGSFNLIPQDFEVHEEIHQTKLCVGLLIDESSSMKSGGKLGAAMEAALALSALISKEPQDSLKVFVFSEEVKQIPAWAIPNEVASHGATDIRAAMRAFRRAVRNEKGERQAYLITDTDPNTEDGRYLGFEKAMPGVISEALRYRQENIGLNIIMLDESAKLRNLASIMARKNLGKAFFTSPEGLGRVVVRDYLRARRR